MSYLIFLIPVSIFGLLVWAITSATKQAEKDWKTLKYLEDKAQQVSTKEEIEKFHKEFVEEATNIHNKFINPRLMKIDGYLRGLHKQFKNKESDHE